MQRLSRAARADQLSIPVFEVLLARSVFLLAFALAGCAYSRCNPFGHRCAPVEGSAGVLGQLEARQGGPC